MGRQGKLTTGSAGMLAHLCLDRHGRRRILIGQGVGIGPFIAAGREQFRMDIVIVGVLAMALVAYLANVILRYAVARLVPWSGAAR